MRSEAALRTSRWLKGHFDVAVSAINGVGYFGERPTVFPALHDRDAGAVRAAWARATLLLERGAKPEVALRPLVEIVTVAQRDASATPRTLPDGSLAIGYTTPRAEAFGSIATILDHAARTGRHLAVLGRLRVCPAPGCTAVTYDPRRRRSTCSPKCRDAVEAARGRDRQRALRLRSREPEIAAGLAAPAGRCRDQRLATSDGQRERLRILVANGMTESEAATVVDREIARITGTA